MQLLKAKFPHITDPPSDDICYATHNRPVAVQAIAERCDRVIVVGSQHSSTSKRLVEVALQGGADASYLVDYAHQVKPEWLDGVTTVGVTSGASVPEILVQDVIKLLDDHGFHTVEEVTTAAEKLVFSLPRVLRPARTPSGR